MKDFLDHLNDAFDSLYDTVTGSKRASSRDSGDPELDRAWGDLDSFLNARPAATPFSELDRDFAEFDRKFAEARGYKDDFEKLKAEARPKAESDARERSARDNAFRAQGFGSSGTGSKGSKTVNEEEALRNIAIELVRDYHNLELKPGASVDEVRAAYKRLLKQYHPDRFAGDAEKQRTATQITTRLNLSYGRIMAHLGQK